MRRSPMVAIVALLLLVVAGGGIATAHQGRGRGGDTKQVELRVRVSPAKQGHSLRIKVKAKHAPRHTELTGVATVHFVSGDVTTDLADKGHGRQLRVRVPVAADETPGPITVDVIVTLDGVVQPTVTADTEVVVPDEDEREDD